MERIDRGLRFGREVDSVGYPVEVTGVTYKYYEYGWPWSGGLCVNTVILGVR